MLPPNHSSLLRQHQGIGSSGLSRGLDPMTVGQSIFGENPLLDPPVVRGFSQLTCLAQGGFGRVWRARRDSDAVFVALKIPHQTDPETAERLEQEADALQSLDHPHIVRLLGLTEDAARHPVIVMELIEGPSLTERLPEGGFDFDHALQIFLPVLEAVAHAHSRGVVHRDLKPSNILLAADSTPKVSDFGLALSLKDQRVAFSMTRSGVLAGTVEYLAPERYEPGGESSTAADIFALGVILYELLTGRPPRGAWRPLSQVKHLDVRLDDLMAEAIHPDPFQRLPSAAVFRKRLEEIRDSKPRYAGTPLVTAPIRYADAVWTVAGLYFLGAGFCSLLSINNTEVPGVFDLAFNHTKLLGGFWALWSLTIGMGLVWGWQAIRLWRFRRVPLREALPSPFGLQLRSSHGTAALVAIIQLLCAWGPLAYIVWIYSQVWFWATPETPVWERVLGVTRWGSEIPVSPWTWDLSGMFSGDRFWIRDMQPALVPGTWRLHDRQSFFVFTQPLLMALGATSIGIGILVTCAAAILAWWQRRRVFLGLFLVGFSSMIFSLGAAVREEQSDRNEARQDTDGRENRRNEDVHRHRLVGTIIILRQVFDSIFSGSGELPASARDAFDRSVTCSGGTIVERAEFLRRVATERREAILEGRTVEAMRFRLVLSDKPEAFGTSIHFESYADPPEQPSVGASCILDCKGSLSDEPLKGFLSEWSLQTDTLYTAEPRTLDTQEAHAWIEAFFSSLSAPACPELESFLLPTMLLIEPSDTRQYSPGPRESFAAALRASRASWSTLEMKPASAPILRRLPGSRWELTCDITPSGCRPDGRRESAPRPLRWQFEIVFTDGRWQALRIRM